MTATCKRLATLHLREEEQLSDQLTHHRQHLRQTTHSLDLRISVQLRMAPIRATRHRPFARRFHARIEHGTKVTQPLSRDRSTEQRITISMKLLAVSHRSLDSLTTNASL